MQSIRQLQLVFSLVVLLLCSSKLVAKETIVSLDLGISAIEIQRAAEFIDTYTKMAAASDTIGLVAADEIVQHLIEPSNPNTFATEFDRLKPILSSTQTSNFSVGLERSIALVSGTTSENTILLVSGGQINTTDVESKERYAMWGHQILIPNAASQGVKLTIIVPDISESAEIIETITTASAANTVVELPRDNASVLALSENLNGVTTHTITDKSATDNTTVIASNNTNSQPEFEQKPPSELNLDTSSALASNISTGGDTLEVKTVTDTRDNDSDSVVAPDRIIAADNNTVEPNANPPTESPETDNNPDTEALPSAANPAEVEVELTLKETSQNSTSVTDTSNTIPSVSDSGTSESAEGLTVTSTTVSDNTDDSPQLTDRASSKMVLSLLLVCAIIVAGLGVLFWIFRHWKNSTKAQPLTTETPILDWDGLPVKRTEFDQTIPPNLNHPSEISTPPSDIPEADDATVVDPRLRASAASTPSIQNNILDQPQKAENEFSNTAIAEEFEVFAEHDTSVDEFDVFEKSIRAKKQSKESPAE